MGEWDVFARVRGMAQDCDVCGERVREVFICGGCGAVLCSECVTGQVVLVGSEVVWHG